MSDTFRVAAFNVENLFARPKVFNFRDKSIGDELLKRINAFQKILRKQTYTAADKTKLLKEFTTGPGGNGKPLKDFIEIREDQGKLWKRLHFKIVGVKASGSGAWNGSIEFKKAKFSEIGRQNTAKVIKAVKADIACIVEAENRPGLQSFDTDLLGSRYPYEMLLDGNDRRGIDLGVYSKFPLGGIWTHMFDKKNGKRIFSRDCPEYEIILPNGRPLYLLCNHLKSKGFSTSQASSNARRKSQAQAIRDILDWYDLANEWVIVAGDLNDTPGSAPLRPLISTPNLFDVLELQFPNEPSKRWTYHYKKFEQIDYLLVSKPLKQRFVEAGVERRGIAKLKQLTEAKPEIENETEFPTVTRWTNQASDHGAVFAEFDL